MVQNKLQATKMDKNKFRLQIKALKHTIQREKQKTKVSFLTEKEKYNFMRVVLRKVRKKSIT